MRYDVLVIGSGPAGQKGPLRQPKRGNGSRLSSDSGST